MTYRSDTPAATQSLLNHHGKGHCTPITPLALNLDHDRSMPLRFSQSLNKSTSLPTSPPALADEPIASQGSGGSPSFFDKLKLFPSRSSRSSRPSSTGPSSYIPTTSRGARRNSADAPASPVPSRTSLSPYDQHSPQLLPIDLGRQHISHIVVTPTLELRPSSRPPRRSPKPKVKPKSPPATASTGYAFASPFYAGTPLLDLPVHSKLSHHAPGETPASSPAGVPGEVKGREKVVRPSAGRRKDTPAFEAPFFARKTMGKGRERGEVKDDGEKGRENKKGRAGRMRVGGWVASDGD
jgi:hypothetical protein